MLTRLAERYGWRGVWLIVMGCAWLVFGIGQVIAPETAPQPWLIHEHLPSLWLAMGWWATGTFAVIQGLRGSPIAAKNDAAGHVALYLMPALRVCSYLGAWLVFVGYWIAHRLGASADPVGISQAWYPALVWSLVSVMLAVGASWPNPQAPMPRPPAEAENGET